MSGNILVTCGTGSLGQQVITNLLNMKNVSIKSIFACVREPNKLGAVALFRKGMVIRQADFRDENSVDAAMEGIQTLMFISSGTVDNLLQQHKNVIDAAKKSGTVKHIVFTSFLKVSKESKFAPFCPDLFDTEEYLKASGLNYTIFRNALYMELIPKMLGTDVVSKGSASFPAGDVKVNFVSKADIAEGLAKVLVNLGPHVNKTYAICSKTYKFSEVAFCISRIAGKPIPYKQNTPAEWTASVKITIRQESEVKFLLAVAEGVNSGQMDVTDSTLEKIIGHKTKTVEQFLPTIYKKAAKK